jgi:hypothetical protein
MFLLSLVYNQALADPYFKGLAKAEKTIMAANNKNGVRVWANKGDQRGRQGTYTEGDTGVSSSSTSQGSHELRKQTLYILGNCLAVIKKELESFIYFMCIATCYMQMC